MDDEVLTLIENAMATFKQADEQRLKELEEYRLEAEKWKAEGNRYGWNFHRGMSAGMNTASIIFYRVQRFLESAKRERESALTNTAEIIVNLAMLVERLSYQLSKANPKSDLPSKAMDYLKRNELVRGPDTRDAERRNESTPCRTPRRDPSVARRVAATHGKQGRGEVTMNIGDNVRAKRSIWHEADDEMPTFQFCDRGDLLIVRSMSSEFFPLYVSHEGITDNSFGVNLDEVERNDKESHFPEMRREAQNVDSGC